MQALAVIADQKLSQLAGYLNDADQYSGAYLSDSRREYYFLRLYLGGYAVVLLYLIAGVCRTNKGYPKIVITLMGILVLGLTALACGLLAALV